jgi:hypothetical protein
MVILVFCFGILICVATTGPDQVNDLSLGPTRSTSRCFFLRKPGLFRLEHDLGISFLTFIEQIKCLSRFRKRDAMADWCSEELTPKRNETAALVMMRITKGSARNRLFLATR